MISATSHLPRLLGFITDVGIEVVETAVVGPTFLPGILIDRGRLLVDPQHLLYPGDVLHEAGHIAVTRAAERPNLGGNVTDSKPEKDGEELAVLLWTYAACQALAIPVEVVFHPAGYNGQSEWILDNFRSGTYVGLPLLVWMGLTTTDAFPRMMCWLRD
jgi:hypothetical protein